MVFWKYSPPGRPAPPPGIWDLGAVRGSLLLAVALLVSSASGLPTAAAVPRWQLWRAPAAVGAVQIELRGGRWHLGCGFLLFWQLALRMLCSVEGALQLPSICA
jgi:hypothetical protein